MGNLLQYKTHFKYHKVRSVTSDNIAMYKPNHTAPKLSFLLGNASLGRKILKTYAKMDWQYYMHLQKTGSADGEWVQPTHDMVQWQAFQNTVINSWVLQMLAI